jgi:hypothetical protein
LRLLDERIEIPSGCDQIAWVRAVAAPGCLRTRLFRTPVEPIREPIQGASRSGHGSAQPGKSFGRRPLAKTLPLSVYVIDPSLDLTQSRDDLVAFAAVLRSLQQAIRSST